MKIEDLENLKEAAEKSIEEADDLRVLGEIYREFLGAQGELARILRSIEESETDSEKIEIGKTANAIKEDLRIKFGEKAAILKAKSEELEKSRQYLDVSVPGKKLELGHLHPITIIREKVEMIFSSLGFEIVEGPELETEFFNFDGLNIPADHPARDMWSTFWVDSDEHLLLRTHTSPVQVRYMREHTPPFKIIVPGRIFRYEATDASHDFQFNQFEGLMVGKNISVANFKSVISQFFCAFFEKDVSVRLRPSYFPFTEPSFEMDISCLICGGSGCSVCKNSGWLEIMGAGMVHPNVFKSAGYKAGEWQGFAFGMGFDRLTMMKYGINEIRLLHSGDPRLSKQF